MFSSACFRNWLIRFRRWYGVYCFWARTRSNGEKAGCAITSPIHNHHSFRKRWLSRNYFQDREVEKVSRDELTLDLHGKQAGPYFGISTTSDFENHAWKTCFNNDVMLYDQESNTVPMWRTNALEFRATHESVESFDVSGRRRAYRSETGWQSRTVTLCCITDHRACVVELLLPSGHFEVGNTMDN